jgi:hypothetical protein
MANRSGRRSYWRRDEEGFERRAGNLDRRWGYGRSLDEGLPRGRRERQQPEASYPDPYNAPDYWVSQEEWNQPGPYTGVGPRNYKRSDEKIFEDVCARLTQHAQINACDMEVEVHDGEVTLRGEIDDRRMKRMAEQNVEMIPGVIDVHNELRLRRLGRRPKGDTGDLLSPFPGGPTPTGPAGYDEP